MKRTLTVEVQDHHDWVVVQDAYPLGLQIVHSARTKLQAGKWLDENRERVEFSGQMYGNVHVSIMPLQQWAQETVALMSTPKPWRGLHALAQQMNALTTEAGIARLQSLSALAARNPIGPRGVDELGS